MYTLMHISDLHRSEDSPISNDELMSCLIADCQRLAAERPPISLPDAIIVSGDLVQGLPLGSNDYPTALEKQYYQAFDLLTGLADTFVGGDRSKVIIVPGNHDVDWNMARRAMEPTGRSDKNVQELLSYPNSPYRWSWEDMQLLKITNRDMYENRFKYFCELYGRFYYGAQVAFQLDPKQAWNLFKLDHGKILVCAFNSCVNVDCFNFSGDIPSRAIAQSHLASSDDYSLRIAVWHHDVQGPARRSDYIDLDTVQLMIDKGYRLGLHGHWHKSDASPYLLHTFEEHTMVVLSAGSLCASSSQLPPGFNRQYNIVEILDDYGRARLHVREMSVPSVFSPGRLVALKNRSYADVQWTPAPRSSLVNTGRGGGSDIALVEQIETLITHESYDDAIEIIDKAGGKLGQYGRQLLSEALFRAEKWQRLEQHLSNPQNPDELTKLVLATIALKHWTEGERAILSAERSGQFAPLIIRDLRARLNAEKGISP